MPKYLVGTIVTGRRFDQGSRFFVKGPADTVTGHYRTEEEARRRADELNREDSPAPGALPVTELLK